VCRNGTRLFENFFLHVVPVRAQLCGAAVGMNGFDDALHRLAGGVFNPVFAQLHVNDVAFFQVDDLIGHAGQGHGVASQKVFVGAHTEHQRRAGTRAHHAVGLVTAQHGNGVGAMQLCRGCFDGLEQIAVVVLVNQVRDDFGVGLAGEHIAARLQSGAQFFVVFNDAVVNQTDAARTLCSVWPGAMAEVRMGVVDRGRAMGGPAGVGNA